MSTQTALRTAAFLAVGVAFTCNPVRAEIAPGDDIVNQAGRKLRTYTFVSRQRRQWERVAYGEDRDSDGNNYLVLYTLSSSSDAGYRRDLGTFESVVSRTK